MELNNWNWTLVFLNLPKQQTSLGEHLRFDARSSKVH